MPRILEPIAGIEGVASGATATVKVPTNRRLHGLKLYAQATNSVPATVYGADVIDEVQMYVGGRLIRNVTAAELLGFAAFNNFSITPQNDGVPIYFTDPNRETVDEQQATAWDLWGQSDMTLKVKIKASLTAVSLAAVMSHDEGFATNAQGQRVLNIIKQTPNFFNAGSTYDITALDLSLPIQRVFLYPESGKAIQAVKVVVNDVQTVHDLTAAQNAALLKDYRLVHTPGNGAVYPVCFDLDQQLFDGLPVVRSLRLTVTSSAAGQIKTILEHRSPAYV